MRRTMILLAILVCTVMAKAQTDYTSKITNPSFERDMTGWTYKSLGVQSNDVFTLKAGTKYVEKWTGRGGAVGSASVSQQLTELPPGNYELSVAAQNIQEDTPTAAQTGAWIYADHSKLYTLNSTLTKTAVTVRNTYKVAFDCITGTVTIGFEAKDATGNWIALDNFRLTQVGTNLGAPLAEAITAGETLYGNGNGKEAAQLKTAIDNAKAVAANAQATAQQQADAIIAVNTAIDTYRLANATADHPLDMTDRITNPSFETGDLTGWTASGMSTMDNDFFKVMKGKWYVERWTWEGNSASDGRISQKLTGMPAGRYRLKAGAQNIQQGSPNAQQTGAWLFAGTNTKTVTVTADYTLEFVQVADVLEIGFEAKGATGNWLSVDNFRLEYISNNSDDVTAALNALISEAASIVNKRMNATAEKDLVTALAAAREALAAGSVDGGLPAVATALEAAIANATASIAIFERLAQAITAAQDDLDHSQATLTDDYQKAIDEARTVYNNPSTTDEEAEAVITALAKATFAFKILNGTSSGTPPTVTTDTRFIRGCNWAFGRSTVKGSNIMEEGFCWSTSPDPKVTDNRTTEYINQAGKIYWLRDLKPATIYFMRAYAITNDYAVGYGDVIKFVTVPKGQVGHWYNNGGDEATNDRINYAINTAMDYYWNNLTSIHGFGISVTYSPGTPTADCSYGGSMRVGTSSSYQQPGTIMHEALHGIGVGTHGNWWSADYRPNGIWAGDRVTEALHFWDNNTTTVLAGDNMHLWPYGCNGAHEDTHNDNLYCMMGILAQALNEDGLPGSGEIGYALPYYAFNHDDGVKYYIKNEDPNRGLHSAYLVETANHTLEWKAMDAEEAAADEAAAWYLSFKPSNQYYQLKNAKTGYYITYSGGFKTISVSGSLPATTNIHLMRGRVDVEGHRGYYIIHPESSANPPVLSATTNGKTATANWNIANGATTQRWLILTAEEANNFDNGNLELARNELTELLAQIRKLLETPHSAVDGSPVDETLVQALNSIEAQAASSSKGSEITALTTQAREAAANFLSNVSVTDTAQPFDLTFMMENPDFDTDATTGWTSNNGAPGYDAQGAEFYEKTFTYYQILQNMPAGNYELRANAFQRPGAADAVYAPYSSGTAKVTTSLFINTTTNVVKHICDDRQPSALFNDGGWGSDQKMADGTYIPNCMTGAEKYFAKGLYDSSVSATLDKIGQLRVGIKCTSAPTAYWTMFDHFRLHFFGGASVSEGIRTVDNEENMSTPAIYDLQGRKLRSPQRGLYIIGGKKVVVR